MAAKWFKKKKNLWAIYSPWSCLCRFCKFSPCMVDPWVRSKHLQKRDGWMKTNCCAFFSCYPAWHFQVSRGGVFCGAPTQLSRWTLWRGTYKTSYCIQEEYTQETNIWGGLSLWYFRYGLLHDRYACMQLTQIRSLQICAHIHIEYKHT